MATTRHRFADLEGTLFIAGKITEGGNSGTTVSITNTDISPPFYQAPDVTVSRTSVGVYTLTVNPFRGPMGVAIPSLTASSSATAAYMAVVKAQPTYTSDSLALAIELGTSGTLSDADVYFMILAY